MRTLTQTGRILPPLSAEIIPVGNSALVRTMGPRCISPFRSLAASQGRALAPLNKAYQERRPGPAVLKQLQQAPRFTIRGLDLRDRAIELPLGLDARSTLVSARVLTKLAGGSTRERLLMCTRAGWVFLPDDHKIDLTDESVQLRLGTLSIQS